MTAPNKPFTFSVTANDAASADDWRELSVRTESLGFDALVIPDHLGRQFAPFSALAVAAGVTTSLRVGMLVACNDFRHPTVLAKEIATLDVLSGGRADWGIGAGWFAPEYKAAGLPFDRAPTRVDRLQEAIAISKALFDEDTVSWAGKHYRIAELDGYPKPVQKPHPPLLIGGAQRRMLTLAAREADIVGVAPMPRPRGASATRQDVEADADRQLSWIRTAAGDRFERLVLNMVAFPVIVDAARESRAEKLGARLGIEPNAVVASPHIWLGSIDDIVDDLEERRARWGVSSWTVPAASMNAAAAVVERLAGR